MFSGKLYLSISLSIESLSAIQRSRRKKQVYRKKEKSTDSQARGKMKQINSMKKETVMQCLPSTQSKY